ncbi:MAG: sulfate permease [Desulfomonile tiedjei]|uniref:Sulfate permease n=1 Tax=Desulfomonile tiedjei TaxID=2358 RepID=A0A9D6V545_9BACT|nr:sulfate permease [Desulfomonile tiedjei]
MSRIRGVGIGLRRYLPILNWMPTYERTWLRPDLLAGLTLAAFTIPEAIAYAELAGLPPQAGLYASIAPPLLYMLFGTSRQLVVGPTSAVSVLIASGLATLAIASPEHYAALAAATAIMVGLIALVSYALRLGFLVNFISESVLVGFSTGAALYIASTQLGKMFGIAGSHGQFFERILHIARHLGDANLFALWLGLAGIIVLVVGEHFLRRLPWALIVVLGAIGVMSATDLVQRGVHIIGELPRGIPALSFPPIAFSDVPDLLRTAVGAFVLSYLEGMSMARAFAAKNKYRVDANQELLALGFASIGAGVTNAYPVAGSFSRSALNDSLGARTQLASGIGGILVALVVLFFTELFTNLPEPILASVVLVAVRGLFKVGALRRLYRLRRVEFWTAIGAMAGVLVLGILDGVVIGALLSLLLVIGRASQSRMSVLGKVPGQPQFTDIRQNPENTTIPGLCIIRADEGIFYANTESIRYEILNIVGSTTPTVKTVILDLEMTSDLDLSGVEMLEDLRKDLQESGVQLRLSRVQRSARVLLARVGISDKIGLDRFHPRTLFAVAAYLSEEGVKSAMSCDILPDMIRCVQDLVSARAEHVEAADRDKLETISYRLEMILESIEQMNGSPRNSGRR